MTPEKVAAERLAMLRRFSAGMARSQQSTVGWSEIGQDCTAALWHRLHGGTVTNTDTHVLASLRGTGVHSIIEQSFRQEDPTGERYLIEHPVEVDGVPGHVDCYDKQEHVVEDAKSKDGAGVQSLRLYGPSRAYRWQIHGYGRGLELQGFTPKLVRITAYAIDSSDDVAVWQEPYDPAVAQEALDHRARHAEMVLPPKPQKDAAGWCSKFCQFWDPSGEVGCPGLTSVKDAPEITDPKVIAAMQEYDSIRDEKKRKDAAKAAFEGAEGRAGSLLLSWVGGKPGTKDEIDTEQLVAAFEMFVGPVPRRTVETVSARYPRVTKVKS